MHFARAKQTIPELNHAAFRPRVIKYSARCTADCKADNHVSSLRISHLYVIAATISHYRYYDNRIHTVREKDASSD